MPGNDDFIDADPFDPEVVKAEEDKAYERRDTESETIRAYVTRRKRAYTAVFTTGNADQGDIEFVMLDLAAFCRAYEPTFNPNNQKVQDLLEGRREVFQRIMSFTRLSHDTLFTMYADAKSQGQR